MATKRDAEIQFKQMTYEAQRSGIAPDRFELQLAPESANATHALFGPESGQKQYLGRTYAEAVCFLGGMEFAFRAARRAAHAEAASRDLPVGLCPVKSDHQPHEVQSSTLGRFWCHADQSKREPWSSEQRRSMASTPQRYPTDPEDLPRIQMHDQVD